MTNQTRREFLQNSSKFIGALALFSSGIGTLNAQSITQNKGEIMQDSKTLPTESLTRTLGKSGIKVSSIGLGCMGMSANHGPARDKKEMIKLLQKAVDLGYTFFDTAEVYGPHTNEELLGEALKPYKDKVIINTKFGFYYPFGKQQLDSSRKSIIRAVDGSLRRLQRDCIDLYTQHRVDIDTPIEEVAQTMQMLVKEGKIKAWALGEAGVKTIQKAHKVFAPVAMQSQYSMAFRELENNGIMDTCEKLGITIIAYSPLDRGFLGGSFDKNTTFHPTLDFRASMPRYTKEALEENQKVIDFIKDVAKNKSINGKPASVAQVALAWILSNKSFVVPIPETTKIHRLEENLNARLLHFSQEELKEINTQLNKLVIVGERYAPGSDAAKSVGL
ncbi:aldo/keto reductase [Helicobacter sp. MIT 05-5293]|uniref:aldo/keto reductase n=1 Tax=Helicobacter sp. MIT 05-5293 TaxID=1548149 RepID=UPI0009DE9A60|nr:aldo/keto reductase [Helicobacter sp. MIT 05-5293]TLD80910.1 aldo/keto reductase [Helicobacter sp. MIT 05-5293]